MSAEASGGLMDETTAVQKGRGCVLGGKAHLEAAAYMVSFREHIERFGSGTAFVTVASSGLSDEDVRLLR